MIKCFPQFWILNSFILSPSTNHITYWVFWGQTFRRLLPQLLANNVMAITCLRLDRVNCKQYTWLDRNCPVKITVIGGLSARRFILWLKTRKWRHSIVQNVSGFLFYVVQSKIREQSQFYHRPAPAAFWREGYKSCHYN